MLLSTVCMYVVFLRAKSIQGIVRCFPSKQNITHTHMERELNIFFHRCVLFLVYVVCVCYGENVEMLMHWKSVVSRILFTYTSHR